MKLLQKILLTLIILNTLIYAQENINQTKKQEIVKKIIPIILYTLLEDSSSSTIDKIPPKITIKGDNPLKVIWKSTFIDPGVEVSDNIDKNVTLKVIGSVDTSIIRDYNITYIATDSAGNSASAIRVVQIYRTKEQIENLTRDYKENYYNKAVEAYNKENNNSWTHPYFTYIFPNDADFEPGNPPDNPISSNEWMKIAGVGFSKKLSIPTGPYSYTKELVQEWKAKGLRAGRFHISFTDFLDANDTTGYKLDKVKLKILKDACQLFIDEDIPILISTGSTGGDFVDFNQDWEGSFNHIIDWWRQLAEYFKDTSYLLAFENFIEYHGFDDVPLENTFSAKIDANESRYPEFNSDARRAIDNYVKEIGYNNLNAEMSKVVRVTNPKRVFIFKPRGIGRNNLSSITPWRWGTEIDPYPNNDANNFYWLISSGGGANLRATYIQALRENNATLAQELITQAAYKSWQPVLNYHNITQLPVWISLMGIKLDQEVIDNTLNGITPSTNEVVAYLNWYLDSIQTLAYNKKTMKRDRIPNGFQQSWWLWHFGIEQPYWKDTTVYDWKVADILNTLGSHSFGGDLTLKYYPPKFLSKTPIVKNGAYVDGEFNSTIFYEAISDQDDNITFKKLSGPAWLNVLESGEIRGTPTINDIGDNNFSVAVVGYKGDIDTQTLTIKVDRYQHLNILPTDDAACKEDNATINFGSAISATLISDDKNNTQLAYLKFKVDTPKLIKSATLKPYIVGRNVYLNIYRVENSWNEKDITWNNRPQILEQLQQIKINSKSGAYFNIDLNSTITQNGEYSLMIETTKKEATFYFKESDKAPLLELELE